MDAPFRFFGEWILVAAWDQGKPRRAERAFKPEMIARQKPHRSCVQAGDLLDRGTLLAWGLH